MNLEVAGNVKLGPIKGFYLYHVTKVTWLARLSNKPGFDILTNLVEQALSLLRIFWKLKGGQAIFLADLKHTLKRKWWEQNEVSVIFVHLSESFNEFWHLLIFVEEHVVALWIF